MNNENFVFEIADEIEQIATTIDAILDKLDFLKNGKEEDAQDVSERLYLSKLQANRALAILCEGSDEQENEQETEEIEDSEPRRRFMRLNEAAAYLKLSPRVLRVMAKAGDVPCQKCKNGPSERLTYFFSQSALDNWLKQ